MSCFQFSQVIYPPIKGGEEGFGGSLQNIIVFFADEMDVHLFRKILKSLI